MDRHFQVCLPASRLLTSFGARYAPQDVVAGRVWLGVRGPHPLRRLHIRQEVANRLGRLSVPVFGLRDELNVKRVKNLHDSTEFRSTAFA